MVDWFKTVSARPKVEEKKAPTPPILKVELVEGSNDAIRVEIARSSSTL